MCMSTEALACLRSAEAFPASPQAERAGQADELATRYAASELRASNAALLEQDMAHREVLPGTLKELRTRRATVTPFYWGVKTILKASSRH